MTYGAIIKELDIKLICQPQGKVFYDIHGKNVKSSQLRTVLFYGKTGWIGNKAKNASFDSLFFSLVRKGKIEIPSDHDTCSKCSGTGNVGYNVDSGTCWRCHGLGYKKLNNK